MRALLFPGQGSQRRGMGEGLFESFTDHCDLAERILGFCVPSLCLDDSDGRLHRTEFAQPALFFVHALTYLQRAGSAEEPELLAGHSLGEYNALFAAGCFDLETGLELVKKRGELMARADGGVMVAVIGLAVAEVEEFLRRRGTPEVEIANYNGPRQVVLSGDRDATSDAVEALRQESAARLIALRVSGAFHSRHMDDAAAQFEAFLAGFDLGPPRRPVVANATGRPYRDGEVPGLLAQQMRRPVRWLESMRYLFDHGVEQVEESGTGHTLSRLWKDAREHFSARLRHNSGRRQGRHRPAEEQTPAAAGASPAESLGCPRFRADYGSRYAYAAGSMYRAIASVELVTRMGKAGLLGFFGTGGLSLAAIEDAIVRIQGELAGSGSYGMNLLHGLDDPEHEAATVELFLRHDVRFVEAAAFLGITAPLVQFRYSGARRDSQGRPRARRRVLAKVSRSEIAQAFMEPPPPALVRSLVDAGRLTPGEAEAAGALPVSEDICVEADSGGHTDAGRAYALMPAMARLRDRMMARHGYGERIRLGAAGGIGSPEAAAAAFVLGADFLVTGSINQCSPQAGTSDAVKELLASLDIQDTAYAPAGDLFEMGARVQVVRKGTLFAARANKLQELYRRFPSVEALDAKSRRLLEESYFKRSLDSIWQETREYLARTNAEELARAERNPKAKMARIFQWYFVYSTRAAMAGTAAEAVNFQIHCGPAMGAFNHFVAGTDLEPWRNRHVDAIAQRLMEATAAVLEERLRRITPRS